MDQEKFVTELAKLRTSSTFLTLKGYRNNSAEVADYNIIFHISYKNALEKSIATLEAMSLSNDLDRKAREELMASYQKSLANPDPIEERESAYDYFVDENDVPIKGIKLHRATNTLHLYGLVHQKRVIMPGLPKKPVKSAELTIAKHRLASVCAVSKFRQFIISPERVESISVENLSLLPPE
jgi:hypothetical protein